MNQEKKYKHLTEEDRIAIEDGLRYGLSFKDIAKRIGKDQTTVSKEIRKHIEVTKPQQVIGKPWLNPGPASLSAKKLSTARTRFFSTG